MVAPFNQAWMLLKQRGHELNLPPPRKKGLGILSSRSLSPQDLTDGRVDEASKARRALDHFGELNSMRQPTFSNATEAKNELGRREEITDKMNTLSIAAGQNEAREGQYEEAQRNLDRQTLARMGQQPEADEIEAMGVPPMSRTLSATPPPNIGRAGSSGRPPVGSDDIMSEDLAEHRPHFAESYTNLLNQYGPLDNPFPSPAGLNVRDDLMDWAAGAGRRGTGNPTLPNKNYPEEFLEEPLEGFHNSPASADESAPTQMDMPKTVTTSPRMSKRNKPNESAPTPRMQGRENRKGLPFGQ